MRSRLIAVPGGVCRKDVCARMINGKLCGAPPTYRIRWTEPGGLYSLSCAEHIAWLRENRVLDNVERIEDYVL